MMTSLEVIFVIIDAMANLIISYPELSKVDFDWIQSIREESDPNYFNIVKPHVTLLFSTNKLDVSQLLEHAKVKLHGRKKFSVVFDSTKVVEDDSKTFFHTFLIPSAGFVEINEIHDKLYEEPMADELRHDIPFIPHLGIGTSESEEEMTRLADDINSQNINIKCLIAALSIVQYDGTKVVDIAEFTLV